MLTDSYEYAKEALLGKWVRWIIFIILGLPFALVQFTFDPGKIVDKATGAFHPELIPWGELAILMSVGILLWFFIAGYTVRIYRGTKPAPEFENWAGLFVDGLKLSIVWFLWILPFLIVLAGVIGVVVVTAFSLKGPGVSLLSSLGVVLILLLIALVFALIVLLFGYLGAVRFARTGSIREGLRISKITEMIRTLGWLSYLLALLVMFIVGIAFSFVTTILSLIPFIGWVLVLIVTPFVTILVARYATLVYDQGEGQPGAVVQ